MSSLASSGLRSISGLLKATTSLSRKGTPSMRQYASRTHKSTASSSGQIYCCRNVGFILCFPKLQHIQLRVYSAPAPSIHYKHESIKKKVISLLDKNEPSGPVQMRSNDLSITERNKASSLIPQYLVSIAADPCVQQARILEVFRLYALTMRPLAQDKIDFPDEFQCILPATEQAFRLMSIPELQAMSQFLFDLQSQRLNIIQKLIRALCQECSARLLQKPTFIEAMNLYELALNLYSKALPQKYQEMFNEYFSHNFESASLREKIKLMYFYSLNPKQLSTGLFEKLLSSTTPNVSSMPFKIHGVLACSILKSGVKLHCNLPVLPELVPNLVSCLLASTNLDDLEAFSVTSEIDLMRMSYFHNEDVTSALESFLLSCNEENSFTMPNIQCFLAFLATRSYSEAVYNKIETWLIKFLQDETRESLQLSDLARVLWAFSAASHNCSDSFIEEIKRELHSQWAVDLINTNLLKFVDALVSLAMMGHVDLALCRHAFQPPKGRAVSYGGHLEVKLLSRLSSLRECLSIERPDLVLPPPSARSVSTAPTAPASLLQQRPVLSKLHAALASAPGVAVKFGCPLKTVKLAGVCLYLAHHDSSAIIEDSCASSGDKTRDAGSGGGESCDQHYGPDAARLQECLAQLQRPVSLEVLDDTTTMLECRSGRRHTGMLNYKLRLMEKIGWRCVCISEKDIDQSENVISLVVDKMNSYESL